MSGSEQFIAKLLSDIPALIPLYREHLADNDELLSHVFMGDVARFVTELHAQVFTRPGEADKDRELTELLRLLDEALRSADENLQEMIVVSFLENLDQDDPLFPDLERRFGDALSGALRRLNEG